MGYGLLAATLAGCHKSDPPSSDTANFNGAIWTSLAALFVIPFFVVAAFAAVNHVSQYAATERIPQKFLDG
jgi:hypothetical protein